MIWTFLKSFLLGVSPKVWIYLFAVLIALGAFFWFKHSIHQDGKKEAQAECVAEKNDVLITTIENSQEIKKDREKTDNEVNKMPISNIDSALISNGWMRND